MGAALGSEECRRGRRLDALLVTTLLLGSYGSAGLSPAHEKRPAGTRGAPSAAIARPFLGARGNCTGKVYFLYPVFRKLEVEPGDRVVAFTGIDGIRTLIVLVGDRPFQFEMHGFSYAPEAARVPLPEESYVLLEWGAPADPARASEIARPALLVPIADEDTARGAANGGIAEGACRIVESGGYVDGRAAARTDAVAHPLSFGSNVVVEPYTELIVTVPAGPRGRSSSDGATTIWISVFAAWEYERERDRRDMSAGSRR